MPLSNIFCIEIGVRVKPEKSPSQLHPLPASFTSFAVHYEKMRNHLLETATNSAKIHS